jgi:hypothetical protein
MTFALKHLPSGQFLHISYGFDRLNLGINPKLYSDREAAERDKRLIPECVKRQLEINSNSFIGLTERGKPSWYNNRHKMKLTKSQISKIEWYENALDQLQKRTKFVYNLKITDIVVVEYPEAIT